MPESKIQCNAEKCEICEMWNDPKKMITGTFTMPKDAYDDLMKNFEDIAVLSYLSYPQIQNKHSLASFFGVMILEGLRYMELRDLIERHVSDYSYGLCPIRTEIRAVESPLNKCHKTGSNPVYGEKNK